MQLAICLVAVLLMAFGMEEHEVLEGSGELEHARSDHYNTFDFHCMLFIPIATAFQNILLKKMSGGMHPNTLSCYQNPFLGICCFAVIYFSGAETGFRFMCEDWRVAALIGLMSASAVFQQILKFTAFKLEDASKLAIYQNWQFGYTVLFDFAIFHMHVTAMQAVGLFFMGIALVLKCKT